MLGEQFYMGVIVGFMACMAFVLFFGPEFFARTLRKTMDTSSDDLRKPGDEWKPKGWKPEYED
jgi:hypothetical protein